MAGSRKGLELLSFRKLFGGRRELAFLLQVNVFLVLLGLLFAVEIGLGLCLGSELALASLFLGCRKRTRDVFWSALELTKIMAVWLGLINLSCRCLACAAQLDLKLFACIAFKKVNRELDIYNELLKVFSVQMYKTMDFLPSLRESILELNIISLNINWKYSLYFHFMSGAMVEVVFIEDLDQNQSVGNWINRESKHLFRLNKKLEQGLFSYTSTCNLPLQPRIILLFHFQLFNLNLYLQKNLQDSKFSL